MKAIFVVLFLSIVASNMCVHADTSTPVILFGPNPGIEEKIDALPKKLSYGHALFSAKRTGKAGKVDFGYAGGIDSAEAERILDVVTRRPDGLQYPPRWLAYVRGDHEMARVEIYFVDVCGKRKLAEKFLLIKGPAQWIAISNVHFPPTPCVMPFGTIDPGL